MDNKRKNRILVPVDFSKHSEAALVLASQLADCLKAKPLVLHVVHDPGEMPGYYSKNLKKKHLARIEDSASEMLADFLAQTRKNNSQVKSLAQVDSLLVTGIPTSRILEVAAKEQAMMIVMGSTGRTGLKHLMLGSVAEHVVQLSSIPVTVTKAHK
jgi:nucleotide-binding universal stress UspA family protein